jgi:hypothetical protein
MVNITNGKPLVVTCFVMIAAFVASVVAMVFDPRIITGAPAWLKPAKFAISTAIFAGTIAWVFRYITVWPRFIRAAGWVLSFVLILEVALIDLQAARGTSSHFNAATVFDAVLFGVMGVAIAVLWLASVGVLVALLRQKFSDAALGWALRLGMLITVVGAGAGGLMLRPTAAQIEARRMHQPVTANGGHTVGAPDGGPGLPGIGWSSQHGDLRVPHFFGLHGIQVIAFAGWLISRRRGDARLVMAAAASYMGLIAILTWQALRGQSIIEPDGATAAAMGVWVAATAIGFSVLGFGRRATA